jgi:hypothetical protein
MMVATMIAALPFAAGLDWLEGLLPVLFVLFWIGSQIFNALQQARRGRPPAPVRPVRRAPEPPREAEVRAELERQIEEFLGRPRPPAERPATQRPHPGDPGRAGRRPRAAAGQTPPPLPAAGAVKSAAADRGRGAGRGSDVARHVHDAFAHELEHLTSSLSAAATPGAEPRQPATTAAPAAELAAALRNPATLRQLILLREVLDRPADRW